MSHFTVAVLTNDDTDIDELMNPYQEQFGENEEYTKFIDETDDYRKRYETESLSVFKLGEKSFYPEYSCSKYPDDDGTSRWDKYREQYGEPQNVAYTELFPTFEKYCEFMEYEEKDGRWGYWSNPQGYWDYWLDINPSVYWNDFDEEPLASEVAELKVGDEEYLRSIYPRLAKRGRAIKEGREDFPDEGLDFNEIWNYQRDAMAAEDEEEFVEKNMRWAPYAIITPDGTWNAAGSMGWWGISSESEREALDWVEVAHDIFMKNGDCRVVVLDCHI